MLTSLLCFSLSLLLLICGVYSQEDPPCYKSVITFNISAPCVASGSCDLLDPSVWNGGVVPSNNDLALVSSPQTLSPILSIYFSNKVSLGCLSISNANLNVSDTVTIDYDLNITQTTITVIKGLMSVGIVTSSDYITSVLVTSSSAIIAMPDGVFEAGNNDLSSFYLDETSVLQVVDKGQITILSGTAQLAGTFYTSESGVVELYAQTTLALTSGDVFACLVSFTNVVVPTGFSFSFLQGIVAQQINIQESSSINVSQSIVIQNNIALADGASLNIIDVTQDLSAVTVTGTGSLTVASSKISLSSDSFSGPLVLAGSNNVTFQNYTTQNISFVSFNSIPANTEIIAVYLQVETDSEINIEGNVTVTGVLELYGTFSISGYVYGLGANITILDSLSVAQYIHVEPTESRQSTIILNGEITAPIFAIPSGCSLFLGNGQIYVHGNIELGGNLYVPEATTLNVNGTLASATQSIINIPGLTTGATARIQVSDKAYLVDGTIAFTIIDKPSRNQKYIVISASFVTGFFGGKIPKDIKGEYKTDFVFTDNEVFIRYLSKIKHAKGLPWYGYLLIIIGFISTGGFIYLYLKRRREVRDRYERVN